MMSKFFGSKKKVKLPEPPKVRSLEEIQKEYANVSMVYAQNMYQSAVYKKAALKIEAELERLNNEGAARQKLDAEAAKALAELNKAEQPKEEVKS